MSIVKDTRFCVTDWSAVDHKLWPSVVACAKQSGPIQWSWPRRVTPLSVKYLIKASETYELSNRAVTVDQGSYLIINEGTEYASHISSSEDVETATVFLNSALCSEVMASLSLPTEQLIDEAQGLPHKTVAFIERLYPQDNKVTPILRNIHRLANSASNELEMQEQLHTLTEQLLLVHMDIKREIEQLPFSRASTRNEIYKRLHICRDYMLSNVSSEHSLNDVAAVAGFAPHHFLRVFRQVFAMTPHQYLTKARLDKAQLLVTGSAKSINEICIDVGFESASSFSALYKRYFSLSPLQHRQQAK